MTDAISTAEKPMAKEVTTALRPEPGEAAESISVDGATARACSTVANASLSLVLGTGTVGDGELVLVPYVDCEVNGTFGGDELEKDLSLTLTLDNVAFLIEEFATEFAGLLPVLSSTAAGQIKPVPERIDFTYQCLARAGANIAVALKRLKDLQVQ